MLGIRINGRIDEIIELPNGNLLIGDIKSRALAIVYDDDIAEVSLYYYILRAMFPNRVIEDYAYLRCVNPKSGWQEVKNSNHGTGFSASFQIGLASIVASLKRIRPQQSGMYGV